MSYIDVLIVKVDHNHKSNTLPICHGVPQGSILRPLSYSIYMNDMADDTTLYIIGKTIDEVQQLLSPDLFRFSNWCQDNKLIVNVKKSKCMAIVQESIELK